MTNLQKQTQDLILEGNADEIDFCALNDEFIEQHDFSRVPSFMTKSMGAWTRKNLLLDAWNQFITCEAEFSEYAGIYPEGEGWRALGDMRRSDMLYYFSAYLEGYAKAIKEDVDKHTESDK